MSLFKHKLSGMHYRLVKKRESGVDTYLEVSKDDVPTVEKREWSSRPQEQYSIIRFYQNLELIK